jgi:hypothetical protein
LDGRMFRYPCSVTTIGWDEKAEDLKF